MLKKYTPVACLCGWGGTKELIDGEYYLVSDVEAILNSAQLLKVEIAELANRLYQLNVGCRATRQDIDDIIKLRQLSAVQ